jgi:quercetin dioxygenase-like cupin family protein
MDGASNVRMRWLISHKEKAPNFAMRMFEIEQDGHTPLHSHDSEHEVYVLKGRGLIVMDNEKKEIEQGYVVYVPPQLTHQFINTGDETLQFLCLIPHEKEKIAATNGEIR